MAQAVTAREKARREKQALGIEVERMKRDSEQLQELIEEKEARLMGLSLEYAPVEFAAAVSTAKVKGGEAELAEMEEQAKAIDK